jgi:hypothetical protein
VAQGSMGSQTQTQTSTPVDSSGEGGTRAVLRLRGAHEPQARARVQWAEDVVDNEGLERKSSKGMSPTTLTSIELHSRAGTAINAGRSALAVLNLADRPGGS